jgi:hypothetical protein
VRDKTSFPLTKENVKGHCPGVVSIVIISLSLVSYDRGRLARDETPYSLWEKNLLLVFFFFFHLFFFFFRGVLREAHLLFKSKGWCKEV